MAKARVGAVITTSHQSHVRRGCHGEAAQRASSTPMAHERAMTHARRTTPMLTVKPALKSPHADDVLNARQRRLVGGAGVAASWGATLRGWRRGLAPEPTLSGPSCVLNAGGAGYQIRTRAFSPISAGAVSTRSRGI